MHHYLQMRGRVWAVTSWLLGLTDVRTVAPGAVLVAGLALAVPSANAQGVSLPWAQSPWMQSHGSKARLIGGTLTAAGGRKHLLAGLEIRLDEDWKTYWRNPGDAGGMAPNLSWSGSRNLASARVLYPAPHRFVDAAGETIGYKHGVVLPVEIAASNPAKPVMLALRVEYGVCREICVPAEARFELTITPGHASVPQQLASALSAVPSPAAGEGLHLKSAAAVLSGSSPHLSFDITGATGAGVDLFVEAPGNIYLPMTTKAGQPSQGIQRFSIDLRNVDDIKLLPGKRLRLTMTGPTTSTEQAWIVPQADRPAAAHQ